MMSATNDNSETPPFKNPASAGIKSAAVAASPSLGLDVSGGSAAAAASVAAVEAPPVEEKRVQPILPRLLPRDLLVQEDEVRREFLCDDLNRVCAVAAKYALPILVSTAGQDIEGRKAAFNIWRANLLDTIAVAVPSFGDAMRSDEEVREKIRDGSMSLMDVDTLLLSREQEIQERLASERRARKEALRKSVREVVRDNIDDSGNGHPRFLLLTGDGEMTAWRGWRGARNHGDSTGQAYYIYPVDASKVRLFSPA